MFCSSLRAFNHWQMIGINHMAFTYDTPYTIGAIQMRMDKEPQKNLEKAANMLAEAARKGVQVACLPELFMSHYFCQSEDHGKFQLAESIPGPTTDAISKIAAAHKMVVVASLFERRAAGMYHNTAAILDADGELAGIYRKMHIPDDPLFYEKFYFTPGDLGFYALPTQYGRIGTLICWDQWFPEGARITAMDGASVLFYPTAIGWHPAEKAEFGEEQRDAWVTIQRSHAIANGIYVCSVNRVGHEIEVGDGLQFWGNSFIADPYGKIIAQANDTDEVILTATVDPKLMEKKRQYWPYFRDRRIEHYGAILGHPAR
jgi:N-carbamoylputrescine amidase